MIPTDYQRRVLSVPENWNVLLAGGKGGGKSVGTSLCTLRHVEKYAKKARPLLIRESYKAASTLWENQVDLLTQAYPGVKPNLTDHVIRCPNGAQVEIGQINSPQSYRRHEGRDATLLVFDEYGHVRDRRWVDRLKANLRSRKGVPLRVILTANPGGYQHAYVHRTFIRGRVPWEPFEVDGETWVWAPSTFRDNPHIDQKDYSKRLLAAAGHDRELERAMRDGDWNINRGAFFVDLDEKYHALADADLPVDELAAILPGETHPGKIFWARGAHTYISGDWGLSAPSVVLFCVRLLQPFKKFPAGSLLVIDEIATADPEDPEVGLGWPPSKLADAVVERCAKWNIYPSGVCDDAHGLDDSLLKVFEKNGLYLKRPDKQRVSGWATVKELIANARETPPRKPGLWISPRCRYLWETLPNLIRDPLRPEDLSSTGPDHGADALRYAATHELSVASGGRLTYEEKDAMPTNDQDPLQLPLRTDITPHATRAGCCRATCCAICSPPSLAARRPTPSPAGPASFTGRWATPFKPRRTCSPATTRRGGQGGLCGAAAVRRRGGSCGRPRPKRPSKRATPPSSGGRRDHEALQRARRRNPRYVKELGPKAGNSSLTLW